MAALTALVKNADRMMTAARASSDGVELSFADGCKGLIPFSDIPDIGSQSSLQDLELPNPFIVVLRNREGGIVELPWDFVRHYCDPSYRPRVEAVAATGRTILAERIRHLRQAAGMTQDDLASAAGIGRVTLVRIENGEQSPRYETLVALARSLGREPGELLV